VNTTSIASRHATWALAAAALVFVLPVLAAAQEPVTSFDQLNMRLKPGDTIWVTDASGREVKGKIRELRPSALTLERDGTRAIQADGVRLITTHTGRPVVRGAVYGLLIGAVGGALAVAVTPSENWGGWKALGAVAIAGLCGGAGIGVGALVGAVIPGKTLVIYRAPGTPGASEPPRAGFSIAPIVTPRAKGVAVSVSF
jgi:hypothetical protein